MSDVSPAIARMQEIVDESRGRDASLTSVSSIITGSLGSVYAAEKAVAEAAISLAHQQRLSRMCSETRRMLEVIAAVNPSAVKPEPASVPAEASWWFALSEALQVLEAAIAQLSALVARQKKGADVRDLAAQALKILKDHYNVLFSEARTWLDG